MAAHANIGPRTVFHELKIRTVGSVQLSVNFLFFHPEHPAISLRMPS
jgi:hypothetical protein